MREDGQKGIRVAGGYCLACNTHWVSVTVPGAPELARHGLTHDEAHALWTRISELLKSIERDTAAEILNEVFALLGVGEGVRAVAAAKVHAMPPGSRNPQAN